MTDIFSEIEEDIRKDRAKRMWERFGKYIIAGAVLIVLAVAAWRGYEAWTNAQAAAAGDRFLDALELSEESPDLAKEALEEVIASGPAGYATLARFRLAGELSEDDPQAGLNAFREIMDDAGVTPMLRDVARLRYGYLSLDHGDLQEVEALFIQMSESDHPFSHSARELRGFAAMKAGNDAQALELFTSLITDFQSPESVRSRAQVALDVLASRGAASSGV